jgi:hypothetical protein
LKDKFVTYVTRHFIQFKHLAGKPPGQQRIARDVSTQLNGRATQAVTAFITRNHTIPLQLVGWRDENL